MDLKSKIILISGPTASGKSKFAIKLAKKIDGEIINADSMQVYKELRILTARPHQKDYQNIKHHPTACNKNGCVCISITENDVIFFGKFASILNLFTFIKSFFK